MLTLVNGVETGLVATADRGLQYGDGLFETIAVRNGKPRLWERHLQRLQNGCERLQIAMPENSLLEHEMQQAMQGEREAVVKIVLTRGAGGRGYRFDTATPPTRIISTHPWPTYPEQNRSQGVAVRWCRTPLARQPLLAGLKHLNRLEQVLARAEWREEYAEGLMCDSAGQVIEGTMSNLFLVRNGVLLTPDLSQCGVEGVMRAEVLDRARQLGIETKIQPITPVAVSSADEMFITNAVIGLWPVSSLESKRYAVGKVTQALQAALSDTD
jgi:4-amino-4-deoxychorismate lyase